MNLRATPLDVPLVDPFVIATGRLDSVTNVAVRLELASGAVGWGEIAVLPPVTRATQAEALSLVREVADAWMGRDVSDWKAWAGDLVDRLPEVPAVRAGVEMALLDALARAQGVSLHRWFGDGGATVETDVTIPICEPARAEALARQWAAGGFTVLKSKVGSDLDLDLERLRAIRRGHPRCALVLDANEGWSADQALEAVTRLVAEGITPSLLEQPVPRDDWEGLGRVARESGVPVAADESCRTPEDARRIVREALAPVINVKLAKSGVAGALEIVSVARRAGLGLMMGAMVETRLGIGFAAGLVAGLGGFDWVDLDTPLLMAADPLLGGYTTRGPTFRLAHDAPGHGMDLAAQEA